MKSCFEKPDTVRTLYVEGNGSLPSACYKVYAHKDVFELADKRPSSTSLPEEKWTDEVKELLRRPRIPSGTSQWKEARNYLITATNIAPIKKIKGAFKSRNAVMKEKVWGSTKDIDSALTYGRVNEPLALEVLCEVLKLPIYKGDVGLILRKEDEELICDDKKNCSSTDLVSKIVAFVKKNPHIPLIGATPDSISLLDSFLIEIKCPYLEKNFDPYKIHPRYYEQIQCQMEVCRSPCCYFVQFIPAKAPYLNNEICHGHISIARVRYDPEWIASTLPELDEFAEDVAEEKELKEQGLIPIPKSHRPRSPMLFQDNLVCDF